ncbi:Membrane-associated transporter protein [Lamellibrachia satsuma]|nr:Membrane-associated transporter protein [Lamellibrachia satsuma]
MNPEVMICPQVSRRKTRLELVMLSCAVCGIEFCYAAETALVSPTLLKIGVHVVYMSLVWCISPVLGFLLVPLMGSLSDGCRSRLGRRRPFILLLSVGIALGLVAVPYGKTIGVMLGDIYSVYVPPALGGANVTNSPLGVAAVTIADYAGNVTVGNDEDVTTPYPGDAPTAPPIGNHHTWGILFTIIGVVLLDFSCDACQSPCRAYLVDVCMPEDHGAGLSTFTVMAGLGGSLGYVLGGVDWEQTPLAGSVGGSHSNVVFLMVWCIYVVCAALTMCSVREVPLDRLKFAETLERKNKNKKPRKDGGRKYRKFTNEDSSDDGDGGGGGGTVNYGTHGHPHIELVIVPPEKDPTKDDSDEDTRRSQNGSTTCPPEAAHDVAQPPPVELDPLPAEVALKTYLVSIVRMPRSMAVLCLTNLFSWMSLVSYSLYFTDFVGQTVYGGDPFSPLGSPAHGRYERGVRMGSFAMAFYSISCSIYSLNIEKLVKRFASFVRKSRNKF